MNNSRKIIQRVTTPVVIVIIVFITVYFIAPQLIDANIKKALDDFADKSKLYLTGLHLRIHVRNQRISDLKDAEKQAEIDAALKHETCQTSNEALDCANAAASSAAQSHISSTEAVLHFENAVDAIAITSENYDNAAEIRANSHLIMVYSEINNIRAHQGQWTTRERRLAKFEELLNYHNTTYTTALTPSLRILTL